MRCFWYYLKGLLKGFWWPFRLLKLVKYSQSYSPNEVCDRNTTLYSKELCLGCCHFESVLFGFMDNRSANLYVKNSSGLVIFDTSIYYIKYI